MEIFCLLSKALRLQESANDQKIMDMTMETGFIKTHQNDYTKHSQLQDKFQPHHADKARMDNSRESSTNDVTDVQARTNETLYKTKGAATEMLKILKSIHKRSSEFSNDQYFSEPNGSTISPPDDFSEDKISVNPSDTSENGDSASINESNNTGSSEFSNGAGSSELIDSAGSKKSDSLSSSEEHTYNYDSQESTHVTLDELNQSPNLIGTTAQSDSSESEMQNQMMTATPDDVSENSNESRGSSIKADTEISSESQSAIISSESNDQSDYGKSSSSSDPNTSSDSSEPLTATTTDKINENLQI